MLFHTGFIPWDHIAKNYKGFLSLYQFKMAVKSNGWKCEVITVVNRTSEQGNLLISNGAWPIGL